VQAGRGDQAGLRLDDMVGKDPVLAFVAGLDPCQARSRPVPPGDRPVRGDDLLMRAAAWR